MRCATFTALALSAIVFLVAAEKQKAVDSIQLPAPAAESQWNADQKREQISGIAVRSDGKYLTIGANLKNKLTTRAGTELRVYIDTDNNTATGGADKSGTRKGYEYNAVVRACIESVGGDLNCGDGLHTKNPKSYSGFADVERYKTGDPANGTDSVRDFFNGAEPTPSDGKLVEGKIAYADLDLKPGQTIRLSVTTASIDNDYNFFPDILLKLK